MGIGNIPNLIPPECSSPTTIPPSLSGYTLNMNHAKHKNVTVTLGAPIFSQNSLVGRRTLVYNITTKPRISNGDLVLKMSWQICRRLSEVHILNQATDHGVEHLPELHMWMESDNEYNLSQGVRGKLFPGNMRDNGGKVYEDRCLRFMVFTKYEAITLIISPSNLDYIFLQLIDCLEKLRAAFIVHRNLSVTNLMHDPQRRVGEKPYLILNDFDRATFTTFMDADDSLAAEKRSKCGTLPFMACDILVDRPKPHFLRHDLESAFYIVVWLVVNYPVDTNEEEQKTKRNILKHWEEGNLPTIFDAKIKFMNQYSEFKRIVNCRSSVFKPYGVWLMQIRNIFRDGYQVKAKNEDERHLKSMTADSFGDPLSEIPETFPGEETLNGIVTPTAIRDALKMARVRLQTVVESFCGGV
ncbi:hypothetical protein ABKN59_011921 [Abortiporus biennis]